MEIQWPLALFTVFVGTASWFFFFVVLGHQFKRTPIKDKNAFSLSIIALVVLSIGGLASIVHLSHPERMLEALNHPTSGIFLEALFLGILALLIVTYAILIKRVKAGSFVLKLVGGVAMLVAVVYSFVLGYSYMMASRPAWDTLLLPLTYAVTAAISGASAYAFILGLFKESLEEAKSTGIALMIIGVLGGIVAVAYGCTTPIAFGDLAPLFWGLVVVIGFVAPAFCGFVIWKKPEQALLFGGIALAAALTGGLAFRACMWLTGETLLNLLATPRY